jgi:hypothetical protein
MQVCRDPEALAALSESLHGTCSPHLLMVVLNHDEWLSYIIHWRANPDPYHGRPMVYGVMTATPSGHDVDLRDKLQPPGAAHDLSTHSVTVPVPSP